MQYLLNSLYEHVVEDIWLTKIHCQLDHKWKNKWSVFELYLQSLPMLLNSNYSSKKCQCENPITSTITYNVTKVDKSSTTKKIFDISLEKV